MPASKIRRSDWHSVRQRKPLVIGFAMTLHDRLKWEGIDHVESLVCRRLAQFDRRSGVRQRQGTRAGEITSRSQPRGQHSASRSRARSHGTSTGSGSSTRTDADTGSRSSPSTGTNTGSRTGGSIDSNASTGSQIESDDSCGTEPLAFLQPSRSFAASD